ncbi:hypothetical protein HMPREF3050_03025 [Neisseria sp. HMSC065D04]|jgi:hypothetical protein|uniref:AbiTii domain-containing protein n=1 Tax=Neisseria sp. HMSC065D04 TaxID=1739542 RepID=UPI0008A5C213|nr:hypothetical protein [Neisseria sp. HMSC065D04]OFO36012.1 hypothetical protein HMPREF3050_03025 [Neisseria sp. HMSC065D04]
MTSIILELQELAANPNSDVEELLNKTYMVARKLKISKLINWCQNELSGYQTDDMPDYRKFYGQLKVLHPYTGQYIPFHVPDETKQLLTLIEFEPSIGVIRNLLLNNTNGFFEKTIPNEVRTWLIEAQETAIPFEPKIIFHKSDLMNIQSKIRNMILDWALTLEEEDFSEEGIQFSKTKKELAMTNQFNIQNMQGYVGNFSGGNIQQNIHDGIHIEKGNFDSLAEYLVKNGIPYSELSKLKIALNEDSPPINTKNFGNHVHNWIDDIVKKVSNRIIDIPITTITGLLTKAISKYYGLS